MNFGELNLAIILIQSASTIRPISPTCISNAREDYVKLIELYKK